MKHTMAAVDGSPASLATLQWVARLAERTGADLCALRAWVPDLPAPDREAHAKLRQAALDELPAGRDEPDARRPAGRG